MKLSEKEFSKIRTTLKPELFWFDFVRHVFLPYYQNQNAVTNITNFDITQPVILDENLNLTLPLNMEVAVYYAKNQKPLPIQLNTKISQFVVLLISIILLLLIIFLDVKRTTFPRLNKLLTQYKFVL